MPTPPLRGEIYKITVLEREKVGDEFFGHHWYVVMSRPEVCKLLNVVLAVPLTSPEYKGSGMPKDMSEYRNFRIRILENQKTIEAGESGLKGDSLALVHQVRPLAIERFTNVQISGKLLQPAINVIELALANVLQIPPPGIDPSLTINKMRERAMAPKNEPAPVRPGLPAAKK
jgi:mRNA-degrading endonuclease toxin of MazEF toxin-antitoxin module